MDETLETYDFDPDGSANLDHALLESLFYNEMAMMDDMSGLLSLLDNSTTSSSGISSPALLGQGPNYDVGEDAESVLLLDNSNSNSNYFPLHLPTEAIGHDSSTTDDMGVSNTATNPQSTHLSGVPENTTWRTNLPSSFGNSSSEPHYGTVLAAGHTSTVMNTTQEPARLTPSQLIALTQNRPNRGIRHNVTSTSDTPSVLHNQSLNMTSAAVTNIASPNPITLQPHPTTANIQAIGARYGVMHPSVPYNNLPAIPNPLGSSSIAITPLPPVATTIQYQGTDPAFMPHRAVTHVVDIATQNNAVPLSATLAYPTTAKQQSSNVGEEIPPQLESTTDEKKRTKLLSQFATLASRLGITLPPQVLKHLTDGKTTTVNVDLLNTRTVLPNQVNIKPSGFGDVSGAPTIQAELVQSSSDGKTDDITPTLPKVHGSAILELQATAAEAIAAATSRQRFSPENSSDEEDDNNNGKKKGSSKMYSRRRKKPRLNECESKLAELRAENEMLKRHLDNISNKTAKLEQERIEVEKTMKRMFDVGAPDTEIDQLLKNYSDMYSDYGKKRDQELCFHLEQLRRLANPTNFTKMGLWTLSQDNSDSTNPIAGILQKELGVTAQQGRKVLEHRQKIQRVCMNLKESLVLLGKLKTLCEQKTKIFHDRMEKCREILSPKQVVKLLMWINENSSTLGSVCPGWGSEQFQAKKIKMPSTE